MSADSGFVEILLGAESALQRVCDLVRELESDEGATTVNDTNVVDVLLGLVALDARLGTWFDGCDVDDAPEAPEGISPPPLPVRELLR